MTDALISEAKRSPAPGPADSETRKEVFIACIHRPGFDRCVPNILISEKNRVGGLGYDSDFSDYNLQRNWPLLKIIGCFECKKEARAAIDISFYAMKTEGVVDPRASLLKMRSENYPWVEDQGNEYTSDDDDFDDERFRSRFFDHFDDERFPLEKAFKLVRSQKGAPTLWSIFPFDMHLTQWALSEVFVASNQYNAPCACAGGGEEIEIIGAFQGAAEARTAVESKKERLKAHVFQDYAEDEEDVPPLSPQEFPSTLIIPDKDIAENWHADGTGCISFQARSYSCGQGIHRASLRVLKVSNVPASKPIKLLAAAKSLLHTLVWLQLCSPQGNALFSFVQLPTPVLSPFAAARVSGVLTRLERLRVVGCGFKGELMRLLSLGMGHQCELQRNAGASYKIMLGIARRVGAGLAAFINPKSQSKKRARRDCSEVDA
jgi:hypothetical protein